MKILASIIMLIFCALVLYGVGWLLVESFKISKGTGIVVICGLIFTAATSWAINYLQKH